MSFKNLNEVVFDAATQSATNTITSSILDCTFLDQLSFQITLTGNANGAFTVQYSNNYDPVKSTGTFVDSTITLTQTAGAVGNPMITLPSFFSYKFVRLKYVNTSDTGTVTAVANGKGI